MAFLKHCFYVFLEFYVIFVMFLFTDFGLLFPNVHYKYIWVGVRIYN